jgi:hypothetical protein
LFIIDSFWTKIPEKGDYEFFINHAVLDIPYDKRLEADIIESFLSDNHYIVFPVIRPQNFNPPFDSEIRFEGEVLRTKGNIMDFKLDEGEYIVWSTPLNRNDLVEILKKEEIGYKCYILEKGRHITEFDYKLRMYEHHEIDDTEHRSLFIETANNNFCREIKPKLHDLIEKHTNSNESLCLSQDEPIYNRPIELETWTWDINGTVYFVNKHRRIDRNEDFYSYNDFINLKFLNSKKEHLFYITKYSGDGKMYFHCNPYLVVNNDLPIILKRLADKYNIKKFSYFEKEHGYRPLDLNYKSESIV